VTHRKTASTITDAELDALYQRIDTLEHVAAGNKRHVQLIVPELERAEAAIARVRALAECWRYTGDRKEGPLRELCAALAEPAPAASPAATQATSHRYLSTGCLHGQHGYCQAHTGLSGTKTPAQCKFCQAPCTCPCHKEQPRV